MSVEPAHGAKFFKLDGASATWWTDEVTYVGEYSIRVACSNGQGKVFQVVQFDLIVSRGRSLSSGECVTCTPIWLDTIKNTFITVNKNSNQREYNVGQTRLFSGCSY